MNHPAIPNTDTHLHPLIYDRYSAVWYAETAPDRATLKRIFEAARLAPSSRNEQPWRFLLASKADDPETYARLLECLSPPNQEWAQSAPVLVATFVKTFIDADQSPNASARYDLGLAVGNLIVQSLASGLQLRQMGGFSRTKLQAAFPPPEGFEPVTVIALGYPGNLAEAPEAVRTRGQQPRTRKALSEIVFEGAFGKAAFGND